MDDEDLSTNEEEKPYVRFRREPLRFLCNEAFFAVRRVLPKTWNNRVIAGIEGVVAGYGAAEIGSHVVPERSLHDVTQKCLIGVAGVGLPFIIAPYHVSAWIDDHPTYSAGVFGVITGAAIRGFQELFL